MIKQTIFADRTPVTDSEMQISQIVLNLKIIYKKRKYLFFYNI